MAVAQKSGFTVAGANEIAFILRPQDFEEFTTFIIGTIERRRRLWLRIRSGLILVFMVLVTATVVTGDVPRPEAGLIALMLLVVVAVLLMGTRESLAAPGRALYAAMAKEDALERHVQLTTRHATFRERGMFERVAWDRVETLHVRPQGLYVMLGRTVGHIIPAHAFSSAQEYQAYADRALLLWHEGLAHRSGLDLSGQAS